MSYLDHLRKVELNENKVYLDDKVCDLTTNVNPYDPGVKVREVVRNFNTTHLTNKTDDSLKSLKKSLASYHHVNENQIVIFNGLTEALSIIVNTCFNSEKEVMLPKLTCGAHVNALKFNNQAYTTVDMNDDLTINVEALKDNGGIMIKNPNVPTGLALTHAQVEEVLKNNPDSIVVVDEMYEGFSYQSVESVISTYPNLVIVKSMNAYRGLAGINVAYVIASKEVATAIRNVQGLFNRTPVATLSKLIAEASLEDDEYVLKNARMIVKTRDYVKAELEKMGFTVLDSKGNFLLVKHKKTPAKRIAEKLLKRHFYVATYEGELENHIGFTISTQDIMTAFLKEMKHAS